MRHRVKGKKFGRNASSRKAMLQSLMVGVITHGKIETTIEKAKYARPAVEKLVTAAKNDTLHVRRILIKKLQDMNAVNKLIDELGPLFKDRKGGYTRITRTIIRKGDKAQLAEFSFVEKPEIKKVEDKKTSKTEKLTKDSKKSPVTEEKKQKISQKAESQKKVNVKENKAVKKKVTK